MYLCVPLRLYHTQVQVPELLLDYEFLRQPRLLLQGIQVQKGSVGEEVPGDCRGRTPAPAPTAASAGRARSDEKEKAGRERQGKEEDEQPERRLRQAERCSTFFGERQEAEQIRDAADGSNVHSGAARAPAEGLDLW